MTDSPNETVTNLPLFRQIVDHLKKQIVDGSLAEHEGLPSERTIAEQHSVSRMTAHKALEAIEAEGLAYSEDRRGRFVSPPRINYNVNSMASFVTDAKRQGVEIEVELIADKKAIADAKLATSLFIAEGSPLFERTRLFSSSGHTIFFETEFIAPELCPELRKPGIRSGSEKLLGERYGTLGHTADIVVRMAPIQPSDAAFLGVTAWQVGIEQEQIVRKKDGTAFCFVRQVWRGELVQFSAQAIENR